MSEGLWVAILQFAVKFGIDAAIAILKRVGVQSTIDDAITALTMASQKTAQQYLDEAKAAAPATPTP